MKNYIKGLDSMIEGAVKKCLESLEDFGLLFSGGLDSSLLAKICMDVGKQPQLISVYMQESGDEQFVKKAATHLNMDLIEKEIFEDEIPYLVESVSKVVSTHDPLDISIGAPVYAAMEVASWCGLNDLMMGQGADELFGGYHRYLKIDPNNLSKVLRSDVNNINIERDITLARALGINLLTPYLDEKVVELGLGIPVDLRVRKGVRKFILRRIAKERGLPREIWNREKKAIQYSTGVDKVVRKIL